MRFRRFFFYLQFWAIAVLPLWLLIGRGIQLAGPGWGLVALLVATPILSLALLVILGLTMARKSVRRSRMLSRTDVLTLSAWYLSLIFLGLVAQPITIIVAVIVGLAVFWIMVWQLLAETRDRISMTLGRFDSIRVESEDLQVVDRALPASTGAPQPGVTE